MRAWHTLGITGLWLAAAFSLAYLLAVPLHKDVAPFIVWMAALVGHIPLLMTYRRKSRVLPVPWAQRPDGYGFPPRKVRFNARSVYRLPPNALLAFGLPTACIMFAANVSESRLVVIAGLSLIWLTIPLIFAGIFVRQYRLMRLGDSTVAHIEDRFEPSKHPENAQLHFSFEANGRLYSGRGDDNGYYLPVGAIVPIFFDAVNPKRRLLACESYFEIVHDIADHTYD
jgi:hypothetical protein